MDTQGEAWADMPMTATFDELLGWTGLYTYSERSGLWQFVFQNGTFYTGRPGENVAYKCDASNVLDTNAMHWNAH